MLTEPTLLRRGSGSISDFIALAHRHQEPPAVANNGEPWTTWLMLGGRGAGKTRPAPNGCARWSRGTRPMPSTAAAHRAGRRDRARSARGDDRGPAGLLRGAPRARAAAMDRRRAAGSNGRTARSAQAFSAEDPEKPARAAIRRRVVRRACQVAPCRCDLRHAAVRAAAWRAAAAADHHHAAADRADQAADRRSAHRGDARRARRPMPRICRRRSSTRCSARYAGTRLGRQEIEGEIIEDRADALWTRALIEAAACRRRRRCCASWSAVDPPGSARPGADACGIVAAGHARERHHLCARRRDACAARAARLGERSDRAVAPAREPTLVVAEGQPGRRHGARRDAADRSARCRSRTVHATRGKWLRAEPVAVLLRAGQGQARRRRCRRWRTRCATSASTGCHRGARPTGSTRWCGPSPTS